MTILPKLYTSHLLTRRQLTSSVLLLVFETAEPLAYQPGQYASWLIGPHRRTMSFATPAAGTRAEFLVDTTLGGVASQFSRQLSPGDTLSFLAPYGRFVVEEENMRPRLFLATGTGLAPIRAQLLADQTNHPTTLIFGTLQPEQRFLDQELRALAEQRSGLTFVPVCQLEAPGWWGAVGHVARIAVDSVADLPDYTAYVCGSPAFVSETTDILMAHGLAQPHIRTEQYT